MTEPSAPAQPDGAPENRSVASAGTLLRQAREAAGLHIGALSVALKVPVRKLEALEADQFDQLPDAVFARALASSVCRNLKIDPSPILERLPGQVMPDLQLDSRTSDRTNLHPPRALWNAPLLARIPRPVLGVALALVLAAAGLLLLPDSITQPPEAVAPMSAPAPQPAPVSATAETPAVAPATEASAATPVLAVPAALPASLSAPVVPATVAAPAAAVAAPVAAASAAAGPAPLALKARGASWVEVTDAAGTVQLRRILQPGEAANVSGATPLSVVVGRADAIEVQVRGQAFDLAPLARDNVARFQIK